MAARPYLGRERHRIVRGDAERHLAVLGREAAAVPIGETLGKEVPVVHLLL